MSSDPTRATTGGLRRGMIVKPVERSLLTRCSPVARAAVECAVLTSSHPDQPLVPALGSGGNASSGASWTSSSRSASDQSAARPARGHDLSAADGARALKCGHMSRFGLHLLERCDRSQRSPTIQRDGSSWSPYPDRLLHKPNGRCCTASGRSGQQALLAAGLERVDELDAELAEIAYVARRHDQSVAACGCGDHRVLQKRF